MSLFQVDSVIIIYERIGVTAQRQSPITPMIIGGRYTIECNFASYITISHDTK